MGILQLKQGVHPRFGITVRGSPKELPRQLANPGGKDKVFFTKRNASKFARQISRISSLPYLGTIHEIKRVI